MAFPRPTTAFLLRRLRLQTGRRALSTPRNPSPAPGAPKDARSRLHQMNDRLPQFLRPYTSRLLNAPVTHTTSFLILHEITAVLPVIGLFAAFHYGSWLPDLSSVPGEQNAFEESVDKIGRWMKKKGWVEESVPTDADHVVAAEDSSGPERSGVHLVLEFATAYAITKALLPVRIAASVWATPWFARTVVGPVGKVAGRLFGRS